VKGDDHLRGRARIHGLPFHRRVRFREAMNLRLLALAALTSIGLCAEPVPIFNGKNFGGWEGETLKTWRVAEGTLVGGSLEEMVPHNEFLATTKSYGNFDLRLKFKLLGSEGFINGGVQFRSTRIPNHHEMIGYQADLGARYWGALYDESRRDKILAAPAPEIVEKAVKLNEWNEYRIRCEGPHIQLWLNGVQTVDYMETAPGIAAAGKIALQIHGGGKAQIWFKDLILEELPAK
jgi:hypothetical protein